MAYALVSRPHDQRSDSFRVGTEQISQIKPVDQSANQSAISELRGSVAVDPPPCFATTIVCVPLSSAVAAAVAQTERL